MTAREVNKWIETAERITNTWDSDGRNTYRVFIYEKAGQLYAIKYCNDRLLERWNGRGFVRGEYEIIAVNYSAKPFEILREEWTDANGKIIAGRDT